MEVERVNVRVSVRVSEQVSGPATSKSVWLLASHPVLYLCSPIQEELASPGVVQEPFAASYLYGRQWG